MFLGTSCLSDSPNHSWSYNFISHHLIISKAVLLALVKLWKSKEIEAGLSRQFSVIRTFSQPCKGDGASLSALRETEVFPALYIIYTADMIPCAGQIGDTISACAFNSRGSEFAMGDSTGRVGMWRREVSIFLIYVCLSRFIVLHPGSEATQQWVHPSFQLSLAQSGMYHQWLFSIIIDFVLSSQFESHDTQFDQLRSVFIAERVVALAYLKQATASSRFILSANGVLIPPKPI